MSAVILAISAMFLFPMLPQSVWAAPTTEKDAQQVVEGWLSLDAAPLGAKVGRYIREVKSFQAEEGSPFYIAYLNPAGFVIVSGDDLVEPIIGFVPEGTFDPTLANPLGALVFKDLPGRVSSARQMEAQGLAISSMPEKAQKARRKWDQLKVSRDLLSSQDLAGFQDFNLTSISDLRVPALIRSKWSQSEVGSAYCYNYYTPKHYVCGCVATAMSQLMRYWRHPTGAVGTGSFTINVDNVPRSENLRGGDGAGGRYVWSSMPLIPENGITDSQRKAIGALTHDAGTSVKMYYSVNGSGTDTLLCGDAFRYTFMYSNARKGYNDGYNLPGTQRDHMVNPNLDAGYPVLFGITGGAGGHAIVCDGYGYNSGTAYHHLNMGWAGLSDAWYNLPTISTSSYSFSSVYKCVYNVYVDGSGEIISGRVLDQDGNPISGALVTASRSGGGTYSATSNNRGIYALAKVPSSSTYTINASKIGYAFDTHSVNTGTSFDNSTVAGNVWGVDFTGNLGPLPSNLSTALDNNIQAFTNGGDAFWFGQSATSYYGGSAAQSGDIADNQTSWFQTTVTGAGTLSFYWKVSSERDHDYLEFYIDGVKQSAISGEEDWQQKTFNVPTGTHTLKWQYRKDEYVSNGSDCGWVDRVAYSASPVISLKTSLDNKSLTFATGGNANWFGQSAVSYYGGSAAKSGAIVDGQSSWLQTTVTGAGTLSFYWKVSSQRDYDYLEFYIDGVKQSAISGEEDWRQKTFNVPTGTHTLKWQYRKNSSVISGSDCGWVDKVTYSPGNPSNLVSSALDNPALTFTHGGDADWFAQSATSFYGSSAAQSGDITDNQTASFQATVYGPGPLSFFWKVSSEGGYDFLQFYIDNTLKDQISGTSDWQQKTYILPKGTHTIKWSYKKDYSVSSGSDCGWVDKLVIPSRNKMAPALLLLLGE
jgi:hypothetical protein